MLKRLIAFLLGHLRLEIRGGHPEVFLNRALADGLFLWHIERTPDSMSVSLTIRDFRALRPVARAARCRVRICSRHGLPFRLARVQRRPMLLLGFACALAFVFWAAGHVWVVEVRVTGPQNLDPRAVEAVAAEAGLTRGVWRGKLDLNRIQQHIQSRMGEISWAGVRLQGTRAVIEVVEKAARTLPNQSACVNLVARKNGVIEEVIPFQGEPFVKKGDIVKAGDLLVECSFKYWSGGRPLVVPGTEKPPRESVARTLVAQAQVNARVSYRLYREVPLVQEVLVPTGRTVTQWVLKWKDETILLRGKEQIPFARYQIHQRSYSLGSWRNWQSPVELVIIDIAEVEARQERIPVEQALSQVKDQLTAQLRWVLSPSDKMLTPVTAAVAEQGADFVGIRVAVDTLEEISAPNEGAAPPLTKPDESKAVPGKP